MADSGWRETTVGVLCDEGVLHTQTGPFGSQLHSYDYVPSGVPVVPTEGIGRRRLLTEGIPEVAEETAARLSRHRLKAGDILFARRGVQATGLSAIVTPRQEGWLCGTGAILLRIKGKGVDPEFLSFLLSTDESVLWLKQHAVGAVMPNLNEGVIRQIPLTLPSLAEQKAIAAVLGALDDKIELNRRMNATLEAMARALFQSWFVNFDPVRAKLDGRLPAALDPATAALFPDSFQDSAIGPMPHGWSVKDLGEIADFDKGLSYKGEGLAEEGGMPMVNLGCFTGRGLFNADRVKRYTGEYRERHLVHAGDLVIANTDMTQNRVIIGSPALVPELNGAKEFLFTHHVFAVRFKPGAEIWRRYVFFTLLKPEFREIAEGFSTGTTVLALPRDGLVNYSLCLPPVPLLEAFEKQVGPLLAAVDANLHQSRTLATLRDTLLPKLLSGELFFSKL